ncbi:uncharacterized protein LOC123552482 [Mercenaria mercenaria]|uniref:uncharacterized protein LOC123552482 n=1 Tax=Mercenaria mercenaria TaxID=6596 RepID=UPI00234F7BB2|nr:uncharacterized protein LOC123552482 [Mercenaria mercenaria]
MQSNIIFSIVCFTGVVAGNYNQKYLEILQGTKIVNVVSSFNDISILECGRNCMEYAQCVQAGYNTCSQTCQISSDNTTVTDPDSVVIKFSDVCGSPQTPKNGNVEISSDGKIATFSCDNDYTLAGTEILHCMHGSWNGTVPTCAGADCGPPILPANGDHFSYTGTALNDVATLVCLPGFAPTVNSVTCQTDGQWESSSCTEDCGTALETDYINVRASYPLGSHAGATATVACAPGYKSDSGLTSWTFTCDATDSQWKIAQAPDCIWELMFRGSAENGYNVTDAFLFGYGSDGVTDEEGCKDVYNTSCTLNYRNSKVDQWDLLNIQEVTYELYDNTNVLSVRFDGSGSTINNWFSTSRVIEHPWSIPVLTNTWWDLNGPTDIMYGRSFRMTAGYEIDAVPCKDHFYTVVFFPPLWSCSYDVFDNYPKFTYSALTGGSIYSYETFYTAATMGIWVKYY